MMAYTVLDNGKPAQLLDSPYEEWHTCEFDSFEEAEEYAREWLGELFDPGENVLTCNNPFDYSGYGDKIEIRFRGTG